MLPTAIGPFKIERELGRGGMGVVYLATDTKLDRPVAIKALPDDLAADPDRLARFQREAKVLASLNHPNIGGIHGLESANGHQYLVLEFIEGETLADRLASGPIPVDEALTIAKQIAEALETAHDKTVIHRDLKPGNVMVTPDGVVKVLDFGLARTAEGAPSSTYVSVKPDSPTVPLAAQHSPSIPGAIMGTAGYMSPEQARGKPVDKRSDIFSFGCVLYEMLTGAGPFPGETVTDSLGAILHREPNWSLLPPTAPPRVRELLTHCLAKDRKERLHDIGDARLELGRAVSGREWNSAVTVPAAGSGRRVPLLICLAGAAGLGIAGWFAGSRLGAEPAAPLRGIKLDLPTRGLTFGQASGPVISPDGKYVVFAAQPATGGSRCLFVRSIDSFEVRPIPDTSTASGDGYAVDTYFWSPDSRAIGFVDDSKLFSVELAGGARRLISTVQYCQSAIWASDGTIIVNTFGGGELSGQIGRVRAEGGTLETLIKAEPKQLLNGVTLLPDGQGFLYYTRHFEPEKTVRMGQLMAWKTGSPKPTLVCELSSQAWYVKPGWLIYVSDGTIKAAPFDLATLKVTGEAATVTDDANYFRPTGFASLSVSTDGTMVHSCPPWKSRAVWFGADGTRQEPFPTQANLSSVSIAPSGSSIAATVNDIRTGTSDVWVYGIARQTATRLTSDPRYEGIPLWSRDGSLLYFSTDWKDYPAVYSIRADGSGQTQSVYDGAGTGSLWWARSVAPDGRALMVHGAVDKLGTELRILPLDSAGVPVLPAAAFRSAPTNETDGRFSPDGKWVSYTCDESGRAEIYIAPFPQSAAGPKVQISSGGGFSSRWSPSGDKLYYFDSAPRQIEGSTRKLMVVDLASPAAFVSPPPPKKLIEVSEDILDYDITPDGKRILVVLTPSDPPPMRVIVNGLPR